MKKKLASAPKPAPKAGALPSAAKFADSKADKENHSSKSPARPKAGRILDRVIGHEATIASLLKAVETNRLSSALVFSGPSGIGKKMTALGLAQALVCERSREACGECGPCVRLALGQSESLLLIEPEGIAIKIEQTRSVLEFLSLQGLGRARVVVFDSAHTLNPQASNALLKVLEEPPADTYFMLVTSQAPTLLPTIRSRAQTARFLPLSDSEVAKALQALGEEPMSESGLREARGSVEEALRLRSEAESTSEIRAALKDFLGSPSGALPADALARLRESCDDRSKALLAMRLVQEMARDLARQASASGARSGAGSSAKSVDARLQLALTLGALGLAAERDISGNVDRMLIFENLWLDWNQARSGADSRARLPIRADARGATGARYVD